LEDMFVIDAATLYCQRTRSGQLCALAQIDGATIKRVIDDWGHACLDTTAIYGDVSGTEEGDFAARIWHGRHDVAAVIAACYL
ncbi:MAG: hypothetical protein WBF58_03820, partial [Xanthobacteraceae bacterium]